MQERRYEPDGTLVRTITSAYDTFGNLLTTANPDSNYAYTYDTLDRLTSVDNSGIPVCLSSS